jgi:hypothetical protein
MTEMRIPFGATDSTSYLAFQKARARNEKW